MSEKEKLNIEFDLPSKKIHVEHLFCSKGHSLIDPETRISGHSAIKVKVQHKDREGFLFLDPVYGSYNNIEKGIEIPDGAVVEISCPECGEKLTEENENCRLCASPLYIFHLPKHGIIEGCLKKGCHFHKMKIVGAEEQMSRLFENHTLESFL